MGAQPKKPEREEADELQPQGTLPGQPQPAMENAAKVEPTQGHAPSKYYKLLGVPLPTPALIRDANGFQWLHFGADIMGEARIVEQLKAAYTQIGTMAAVMIIFSTNMLLARTKLDIRSDIGARKQVMNFYTLAWILADVSFVLCAIFCVMLKLAMNECPDEVCAVRFADRFGGLSMAPIFMLLIAWSQDWKRDLWLFLKTENPFISTLFSHPDHPYSPAERRNGLVLASQSAAVATTKTLVFGTILNTLFDRFYKYSVICPCVQRDSAACVKWCAETLGKCTILIMTVIVGAVLIGGIVAVANPKSRPGEPNGTFWVAMWQGPVAKLQDILVTSLGTSCIMFAYTRRGQMKPTDPKKLLVWSGKKRVRGRCGCGWKSPKGELWLKWIGEDKGFEDLPPRPPTYFIKPGRCYACCACLNCCCVCCATGVATWLARRETGDAGVDATDERTLAKYKYLAVYGEDARDRADVEAPAAVPA